MPSWLWLIIMAITVRAFFSIAAKTVTTHVRIHSTTLSTLLLLGSGFLALVLSPFFGGLDFNGLADHWVKAVVMAVSLGLGNIVYFKGQDMIDSGTTQVALASKLIWTALLAIPLLGSSYDWTQLAGMGILVVAILVVAGNLSSKIASTGAIIIALSAVAFSLNSLTSADIASELSAPAYLLISYFGAGVFSLTSGTKYLRKDLTYIKEHASMSAKYIFLAASTSLVYFILLYYTFREAGEDRDLAAILTNAQIVTTVIFASMLLKERENFYRKLAAGVLVVVSAYLIAGL